MGMLKKIKNGFHKLFGKKEKSGVSAEPMMTLEVTEAGSDYLVLATNSIEDDYVVIDSSEFDAENARYQDAAAMELIAKSEVYKLSIPREEKADAADAATYRLEKEGYTLSHLGNDEAREKGLFIYALVKSNAGNAPIVIGCRGTALDASMILDLDPQGPAATMMQNMKPELMSQLNALAAQYPGRKFQVTGHSLGGSLAQIITTNILEKVAEEKSIASVSDMNEALPFAEEGHPASPLSQIPGVDLVTFQSAWVSDEACALAKTSAESIKKCDQAFEISVLTHIKQGDFVSRMGDHVLSDIDPAVAVVQLDMRALDKPMLTLGDAMDIGMVSVATASPAAAAMTTLSKLFSRYAKNRLKAHTEKFHHAEDDHTNTKLTGPTYAVLSNQNEWERARISHVLKKNDLAKVPAQSQIAGAVHECTKELNSVEIGVAISVAATATTAVCLLSKPSLGSACALAGSATAAADKCAKNSGAASSLYKKCKQLFRRKPSETV